VPIRTTPTNPSRSAALYCLRAHRQCAVTEGGRPPPNQPSLEALTADILSRSAGGRELSGPGPGPERERLPSPARRDDTPCAASPSWAVSGGWC